MSLFLCSRWSNVLVIVIADRKDSGSEHTGVAAGHLSAVFGPYISSLAFCLEKATRPADKK